MFILLESKAPSTNPRPEWRRLTSRGSCYWQMHDTEGPPTPSLHLHARSHKRMGTSDWPLPRVTSIAQAGGAARCSSAVAMAADKLLSWMQGSRYSVHLCDKHPQHGFIKKNKGGLFVLFWGFFFFWVGRGAFCGNAAGIERGLIFMHFRRESLTERHLSVEDNSARPPYWTSDFVW